MSPRRLGFVTLLVAGAMGFAVARWGGTALVPLGALLGAALFLLHPLAGLLAVVATIPLEGALALESGITTTRLLGTAVFALWLGHKLVRRETLHRALASPTMALIVLFAAFAIASWFWATYREAARTGAMQMVQMVALTVLVADVVRSASRQDAVVKMLVASGTVAAWLTVAQYFQEGARRAGGDISGNVNYTAAMLVTLVPFGFYLFRTQARAVWRALGVVFVLTAIVAVAVTFSRMSFLMLPVVLAVQYWETLRRRRGRMWLIAMTACGALFVARYVPWQDVGARFMTVGEQVEGFADPLTGASGGRGYHTRVGLAMFRDHPVVGVGLGNYRYHFLYRYQFLVSGAGGLFYSPRNPHSSHVGLLADLGVIGLILWVGVLGVAAVALLRTRAALARRRSPDLPLIQALSCAFLVESFVYGWYASVHTEKLFWTLLGLGIAARTLPSLARGGTASRERLPRAARVA